MKGYVEGTNLNRLVNCHCIIVIDPMANVAQRYGLRLSIVACAFRPFACLLGVNICQTIGDQISCTTYIFMQ